MMEICENCLHYSACLINSEYVPSACTAYKDKTDVAPRAEVAREIFAEVERLMFDGLIGGKYPAKVIAPEKYAELKKKYTEGNK